MSEEHAAADARVVVTTAATDRAVRSMERTNRVIRGLWTLLLLLILVAVVSTLTEIVVHQNHVSKIRGQQTAEIIGLVTQVKALQVAGHQTGLANQQILKIVQSVTSSAAQAQSAATLKLAVSCIADVVNADTGRTTAPIPAACMPILGP